MMTKKPPMHQTMMQSAKPAASQPAPAKEQNTLKWLLGFKETPEEQKAREAREQRDKRSREVIDSAVKGGQLPKAKK
jgi:hypothetical protein